MNSKTLRIGATVVVSLLSMMCHGRGSYQDHVKDFFEVFNGYRDNNRDNTLRNFYENFSRNIDDNKNAETSMSVSARIKRRLAEKYKRPLSEIHLTTHRYIAHKWKFGGSISFADLMILDSKDKFPGCKPIIIDVWKEFCGESHDFIAKEMFPGAHKELPKSYCKVLYYTHLLADWLPAPVNNLKPEEKKEILMSVKDIVLELQFAVEKMESSEEHKKYCNEFKKRMSAALFAAGSNEEKGAEKALEALKSMKLGTMLHERFGKKGQIDEKRYPYREEQEQPQLKKAA